MAGAPPFRWPKPSQVLALVRECAKEMPEKTSDYEVIAERLSSAFSTEHQEVTIKARGAKEKMERILKKYKGEDNQSLKR